MYKRYYIMQSSSYRLISKDRTYDTVFIAVNKLLERLKTIKDPTISDITKTHASFLTTVYKPFINVGSFYHIVKPSGYGSINFSNSEQKISFTIPTYGHFTSDICCQIRLLWVCFLGQDH